VQTELGVACDSPGRVIRQPAALAGRNSVVLGPAWSRPEEGGCAPNERGFAVVHVKVVVYAVPSMRTPVTRNVAVGGKVMHACDAVMSPKSNDHNPPGVSGWLLGKPSTCNDSHWPPWHVPLVTSSVTPERGSRPDEQERVTKTTKGTARSCLFEAHAIETSTTTDATK
jgi:hypothetical protein